MFIIHNVRNGGLPCNGQKKAYLGDKNFAIADDENFAKSKIEWQVNSIKPGFHMVITVVKIESRSFSSAKIQHFRTENARSVYN